MKVDRRGRSTGVPASSRVRAALGIPKDVGWCVMMPHEVLNSAALQVLPLRARRFLDAVMAEHASQGGQENGDLIVTFDQAVARGIDRDAIPFAVAELAAVGLVAVYRGQRASGLRIPANRYRLTWLGTPDGVGPTNEWLGVDEEVARQGIKKAHALIAENRAQKRLERDAKQECDAKQGRPAAG